MLTCVFSHFFLFVLVRCAVVGCYLLVTKLKFYLCSVAIYRISIYLDFFPWILQMVWTFWPGHFAQWGAFRLLVGQHGCVGGSFV